MPSSAALLAAATALLLAAFVAAKQQNCPGSSCCVGGPCKAECCEMDGWQPCGGNSCTEKKGKPPTGTGCAARNCGIFPGPQPPPPGPGNWFVKCSGGADGCSAKDANCFSCFTDAPAFLVALANHEPTNGSINFNGTGLGCKLALQCDAAARCSIPDALCPGSNVEPCVGLERGLQVFFKNVDIGPHENDDPMGGGGGLLRVDDDSTFVGVGVLFHGGVALNDGGAITLDQGHLACANCTWRNNTVKAEGGHAAGGAMFNHNLYGSVVLESPTFVQNTPPPSDDCKCGGCWTRAAKPPTCPSAPAAYCSAACIDTVHKLCDARPLKCCTCSGSGCPSCCVAPGQFPISGGNIGCLGMPFLKEKLRALTPK